MRRMQWLAFLAGVAILTTGCGGVAQKPAVPVSPSSASSPAVTPSTPEIARPTRVGFEVVAEAMLPAELAPWRESKEASGSARVGDFVYVLLSGGGKAAGAADIIPTQVELTERPKPLLSVSAVLMPNKEPGTAFPRAYIRIPYAASLPVPAVQIQVEWQTARLEPPSPASPATPAASPPETPVSSPAIPVLPPPPPETPVSNPATPVLPPPPQQPPVTGTPTPPPGTPLPVTAIRESELPASLADWKRSTVQIPNGIARYAEGSLYLMVSAGQRNSGGYSVALRSVSWHNGAIFVTAVLNQPKPGQMVTQAITYPRAYARVEMAGEGEVQVIVSWQ